MQAADQQKAAVERQLASCAARGFPRPSAGEAKELLKQLFQANKAMADLEFTPAAPPKADVLSTCATPGTTRCSCAARPRTRGPS
jgi:hypothetical protein